MRSHFDRSCALVALAALAGCGSPGGGSSVPTVDALYDQLIVALCQYQARCGLIGNSEEKGCEDSGRRFINAYTAAGADDIRKSVASGRVIYDANAGAACLDLFRKTDCAGFFGNLVGNSCEKVFRGTVDAGGACGNSNECKSRICNKTGNACMGTCAAEQVTGGDCSMNATCTSTDDYCDSATKKCVLRGGDGASCDGSSHCKSGLTCIGYDPVRMTMGTCKPPATENGACGGGLILDNPCQSGLYCDGAICRRRVALGADCDAKAAFACLDGLVCAHAAAAPTGKCATVLDVGVSCDPMANACPSDTACDMAATKCLSRYDAVGDDCAMTKRCSRSGIFVIPLYCDASANKCAEKVPPGGACTPPPMGATQDQQPCSSNTCDAVTMKCAPSCV